MAAAKEEFLKEFGEHYGYPNGPKSIDQIRATEFKRLQDLVYLDHAGATLYSELQMESVFNDLTSNVYGNPHSQSDSSSATLDIVKDARQQVLDYCNASPKDYKCIFTSGATAALKLVGEAFPWSCNSSFMYTMENHNSVLGIREYALGQGAVAIAVDIEDVHPRITGEKVSPKISLHQVQRRKVAGLLEEEPMGDVYNLFAFPSECNFSGLRFGLDLVKIIKEDSSRSLGISSVCKNGQWLVLIDAAKGCATMPLDLSKYPADFVAISFYKLFGYPTGLGALIVRNDAANLLKKSYFSGGTVAASIADIDFIKRREGIEELFEDGTVSFLSIASIRHGFKILDSLTVSAISRHTSSLALYTRKMLLALRHDNGSSVCILYGRHNSMELCHEMGPIVSFNLKRPDGSWYGYREVEKLASLSGIQLRTGCFCNPGACAKYLGLSHMDLISNTEAGHVCWDDHDVINGKPIGAVRVSFGYMSTFEDAKKFIDFVARSFISPQNHVDHGNQLKGVKGFLDTCYYLKSITIYPIKSCGGFNARSWPLSNNGLKHDREWILKSLSGEFLTLKKVPELGFISSFIDLSQGMLFVESPRCKERLQIKLQLDVCDGVIEDIKLHGERYKVHNYSNETNAWFSEAIGKPCTLLRYSSSNHELLLDKTKGVVTCRDAKSAICFANEAPILLVSEESVSDLNKILCSDVQKGTCGAAMQVDASRFRPNLVVSGGRPYDEDGWRDIRIGNKYFRDRSTGRTIGVGHESSGLYHLSIPPPPIACPAVESPDLLHQRLGHPSLQKLRLMVPSLSKVTTLLCESCQLGKHVRSSFPNRVNKRAASPFALVHSDIWGPSRINSCLGYQYFVSFIDDFSRCTWIFLMKNRSDIFSIFQAFCSEINTQFGTQIKILQSDNAREYLSAQFQSFFTSQGILHHTSCAHTPQQNGVAERKNRHLVETARTLLLHNNLPPPSQCLHIKQWPLTSHECLHIKQWPLTSHEL